MSIFLFGGFQVSSDKITSQSKIYRLDISNNKFTCLDKTIPHYRRYGNCFCVDEFIYLIGGVAERDKTVREIDKYNVKSGEWQTLSLLMPEEKGISILFYDRKIYVIGGMGKEGPISRVLFHSIDDDSDKWEEFTDKLVLPRSFGQAVVCGGLIYALGGESSRFQKTSEVEKHDEIQQDWILIPKMKQERSFFQAAVVGSFIYAIGSTCNNSMERYDTINNVWEECESLPYQVDETSVSVVGKYIYNFGGSNYTEAENFQKMKYCLRYDTEHDSWEELSPMPFRAAGLCSQFVE